NIRFPAFVKWLMATALLVLSLAPAIGQTTIRGTVTNASTGNGIPGASVYLPNTSLGTSTDSLGNYTFTFKEPATQIQFVALGYTSVYKSIPQGNSVTLDVELEEDEQLLDEVTINGKGRYRNRDNPAVELIRKVIEHKKVNRLSRFDYASFEVYEKIMMAVSDVPKFVTHNALTRGYRFAFENVDTTLVPGRSLLPL